MKQPKSSTNTKIRVDDLGYLQDEANRFASTAVDIITAMRRLWEKSPEKKRLEALRRVRGGTLQAA